MGYRFQRARIDRAFTFLEQIDKEDENDENEFLLEEAAYLFPKYSRITFIEPTEEPGLWFEPRCDSMGYLHWHLNLDVDINAYLIRRISECTGIRVSWDNGNAYVVFNRGDSPNERSFSPEPYSPEDIGLAEIRRSHAALKARQAASKREDTADADVP